MDFPLICEITLSINTVDEWLRSNYHSLRPLGRAFSHKASHKVEQYVKETMHVVILSESQDLHGVPLMQSKVVHRCLLKVVS